MVKKEFYVTVGYAIEDLADKANFLEVSYLLIFGRVAFS